MSDVFSYEMAQFLEFRDVEACRKAAAISREDIANHPNENFKIRVIEDETAFRFGYVTNIVAGIKRARRGRKQYVIILPPPNPQYAFVAKMINVPRYPRHHVHTFNMDEYADQDGNTARHYAGIPVLDVSRPVRPISPSCACPRSKSTFPRPKRSTTTQR